VFPVLTASRRRRAVRPAAGTPAHRVPRPESQRRSAPRRRIQGVVALVIEDHADSREMLRQMLEALGARAIVAEDGRDALRLLTAETPDVILCDLLMPELDGFGFIRELRTRPPWRAVPVLAVTALGSDTDYRRTWEAGFAGHLTKPIQASQLEAVIEAVVRASRPSPPSTPR